MRGVVDSLFRHPVKGFTPESLATARLLEGAHFPGDRLFAVEDGPSGFDPDEPAYVSKMKFTVLARLPQIAAVRTRYDDETDVFTAQCEGHGEIDVDLHTEEGRADFASWLTPIVGDDARGVLRVLEAPERHRFMDSRSGFVSIINLASVRDLESRLGRPVDPMRFRGNVYVEDWPAWRELDLAGSTVSLGAARLTALKPIQRCTATHVDPKTAETDIDVVSALRELYGHVNCGVYAEVAMSGDVRVGDPAEVRLDFAP